MRGISRAGASEGERDRGRVSGAGSCRYDDIAPAEIWGIADNRDYQREKCNSYGEELFGQAEELCGAAFLDKRIFCLDGGPR